MGHKTHKFMHNSYYVLLLCIIVMNNTESKREGKRKLRYKFMWFDIFCLYLHESTTIFHYLMI